MNVEVLVTAAGTAQSIEEIAKAIDVVDSEEIGRRVEFSIAEAVRTLPGIRVQQLEGPGSHVTIKTRGLRNQDTAILIDGMRFRDAASIQGDATAFLSDLTVVDTERIELLRGSGSSLYGSHALGGVINVSSRPGGGKTHGEFRTEGGGLGMIRSVLGAGGGLSADRLTYSGSVSHINVTKGSREGLPYGNAGRRTIQSHSADLGVGPAVVFKQLSGEHRELHVYESDGREQVRRSRSGGASARPVGAVRTPTAVQCRQRDIHSESDRSGCAAFRDICEWRRQLSASGRPGEFLSHQLPAG